MALIPFPSGLSFENESLGLVWPGQAALRSPFTAHTQVLTRGSGIWRGSAHFPPTTSEAERRAIERFFARLEGQRNWTELPIDAPAPDTTDEPTVSSVTASDGSLVTELSGDPMYAAGDYLRVGDRLALVDERIEANRYRLLPQAVWTAGDAVKPGATVLARRASGSELLSPHSPDFHGPWIFDWIEAI